MYIYIYTVCVYSMYVHMWHLPIRLLTKVRIPTPAVTTPAVTTPAVTTPSLPPSVGPVCPKCGMFKTSGKLSCCARGGAWFDKCGENGDPSSHHTWAEGIEACNSFPAKAQAQFMLSKQATAHQDLAVSRTVKIDSNTVANCKYLPQMGNAAVFASVLLSFFAVYV